MKFWLLIRVGGLHNRSTFGNDRKILKGGFYVVKLIFVKTRFFFSHDRPKSSKAPTVIWFILLDRYFQKLSNDIK